MPKSKTQPPEALQQAEAMARFEYEAEHNFKPQDPADPEGLARRVAALTPKVAEMQDRLKPPGAGDYLITGPPHPCQNDLVGKWRPGMKPIRRRLSAEAAKELAGPHQPFQIVPATEEKA